MQRLLFVFGVIVVLVAACTQPTPIVKHAPIQFSNAPAIRLAIAELKIVDDYRAPLKDPNVEHLFPVSPAQVVQKWAKTRLLPVATGGAGEFRIVTASVIAKSLPVKKGLKGLVTRDQAKEYTATIQVKLMLRDGTGQSQGVATAKVQASETAPENQSLNDREKLFHRLAQTLAKKFDRTMRLAIQRHLGNFIR